MSLLCLRRSNNTKMRPDKDLKNITPAKQHLRDTLKIIFKALAISPVSLQKK